ncbi:MAG TPA: TIGR01777 family oxidoreductase [Jiangellaceae bacterium]|nr:TIGR01777 family oxidoreductase [Jiangellaceae bacterium]
MRVAITGSSGLIGSALSGSLIADGHEIVRLVRREPTAPNEAQWNPSRGRIDLADLEGVDAAVNLAGAPLGPHRWTSSYKKTILASRTNATRVLTTALAKLDNPPRVLVSASGVAMYGIHHGREFLDEDDLPGTSFLASVCEHWEAAAEPATDADIAVCHVRFGLVISRKGGALARMLPWFRAGLGGPLGGGDQYWSTVSLVDAVRAVRFLLETPGCTGPYNLTSPMPVTNAEFARVLAYTLRRPMLLPVPPFVLRVRLGELAEDILASVRAVPRRLLDSGFSFDHPDARSIVAAGLR